jgi:hypothetical protein
MPLTREQSQQVADQVKKFAADLNLSDDQKEKLRGSLEQAKEKVQAYRTANPNASAVDLVKAVASNRDQIRQQVVSFLTPDQLTKWDSNVKNAKEFLGEKLAA